MVAGTAAVAADPNAAGVGGFRAAEAGFMVAVAVAAFTAAEVVAHSTEVAEAARIAAVDRIEEAAALRIGAGTAVAAEHTAEARAAVRARADLVTAAAVRLAAQEILAAREIRHTPMARGIRSVGLAAARRPEHRPEQHEILVDHSEAQGIPAVRSAAREALLAQQAARLAARETLEAREIRHTRMARGIRLVGIAAEAQRAEGLARPARVTRLADQTRRRTRIRSVQGQDRIEASRMPQARDSIAPRPLLLLSDTRHFPVRGPAAAHSEIPV